MYFPKYWAKAEHEGFRSWRWSDSSVQDAVLKAEQAAREIARRFKAREPLRSIYEYSDRPLREPVIQVLKERGTTPEALITRAGYGSLILNTSSLLIIDIDTPLEESAPNLIAMVWKLFGAKAEQRSTAIPGQAGERITQFVKVNPRWGLRAYETAAGLRLIATHAAFSVNDRETKRVFETLHADPLYARLCERQQTFRARLTPKPWRCGSEAPARRWPWTDAEEEAAFEEWLADYEARATQYATCRFIESLGVSHIADELREVIDTHDTMSKAHSGLPLA